MINVVNKFKDTDIRTKAKYILMAILSLAIIIGYIMIAKYLLSFKPVNFKKIVIVTVVYFIPFVIRILYDKNIIKLKRVDGLISNLLLYFIVVFGSFIIEEYTWNTSFFELDIKDIVLNSIIISVLLFAFVCIFDNLKTSYIMVLSISYVYGLINHFILLFKGCPPRFNDIYALKTAMSVADSYEFDLNKRIIVGFILLVYAIVIISICSPKRFFIISERKIVKVVKIMVRIVVPLLTIISLFVINFGEKFAITIHAWTPSDTFIENGAPATMLVSISESMVEEPEGYSKEKARSIMEQYDGSETAPQIKPTIIVIMNESYSDIGVIGDFESDEYMEYWNSIEDYVMKGNVYTSVLGGGTCNAEFEFLTGSTMAYVGSGCYPYQSYNLSSSFNLAGFLKEKYNYNTAAFHPYIAENWNRPKVYSVMGFDRFYSEDDMEKAEYISWTISDKSNYEKLKEIEGDTNNPQFIFNVTMQNHGGYTSQLKENVELISVEDKYNQYVDVKNYLTLIREADYAFKDLIEYYRQVDEPIIICMFGDHQPTLDESFLQDISKDENEGIAEAQKRYITPYIIWSNYDLGIGQIDKDMSLNYLMANLLDSVGYKTSYTEYLLDLQKKIPIVNAIGYMTQDGVWHSHEEQNEALQDYKIVQYYELFDK